MRKLLLEGLRPPVTVPAPQPSQEALEEVARTVDAAARRRLGRSLAIREVDAGSCNGCELEINALNNAVYDLERFGIRFVASPRHADVLLVTGPVTRNMAFALKRAFDCTPDPKWVVAAGDCAAGCGLFAGSYALVGETGSGAVREVLPVHLHIKGCPPTPMQLLEGLLALLER
jgi:Ni,Fe-hydrogenase III small subunit